MTTTVERTIRTSAAPEVVFPYLVDFRNATEWDAGTDSCERVSGDGGVGTVYKNVSTFAGNSVELEYTTEKVAEPEFVIVGRNRSTTSHDTITVRPDGTGSSVTYRADFDFSGPARFLGPIMKPLLERLGDRTAAQLKETLDRR
ncbi:SRPBCC family protein [Phycicoccus duodecadis]|jgi:carbon monoxide dehydrogenase subunit G|uniref:Carbon monoxide dehydrogenase subunit G n=1 Tax=Phycicoccus duodecadis TaxID=173053 RepID=A0A2N3YIP4_9MICO|nr:SRPBCC family protein [Phycicoccus duodecadis]PKW26726.1 carbon monoxide dehydrogenase subunit G [Phycicoccus duodecadis]